MAEAIYVGDHRGWKIYKLSSPHVGRHGARQFAKAVRRYDGKVIYSQNMNTVYHDVNVRMAL